MTAPRYDRTTDATALPVSLEDVLRHCLVENDEDHGYLRGLVVKARRQVEHILSRQLNTATWAAYFDAFPDAIELTILPVASITSITYVDLDGTTQTLASTEYQTDLASPDRPGRIMPAYGKTWPSTRSSTYNAVTVTFTAGYGSDYTSVPEPIQQAILLLVAHWYRYREPLITGTIATPIPQTVDYLLSTADWGRYG